jgi:hypothetical protein
MTKRRKLLLVAAVVLPVLAYLGWAGYVWLGLPAVQSNVLVGLTESRIRGSYGEPQSDRAGYHALGPDDPPSLPPGPIRTLIFHPHGLLHPAGGELWVWLEQRDGEWICFESCWFRADVQF